MQAGDSRCSATRWRQAARRFSRRLDGWFEPVGPPKVDIDIETWLKELPRGFAVMPGARQAGRSAAMPRSLNFRSRCTGRPGRRWLHGSPARDYSLAVANDFGDSSPATTGGAPPRRSGTCETSARQSAGPILKKSNGIFSWWLSAIIGKSKAAKHLQRSPATPCSVVAEGYSYRD